MNFNKKLILFSLCPFICFIIGYSLCNIFIGNTSYTTPNLIGTTLHDAVVQTSPFHINIQVAAEKECPGIAHGTIVSQKPTAGRLIKSHQSIIVITSKLPNITRAPHVVGLTEEQIQKLCEQLHIKTKIYPIEHNLPTGSCIAQTPNHDQPLPDKKLTIYLAHNSQNLYIMPQLVGKTLSEVLGLLQLHATALSIFYKNQKLTAPYPDNMIIAAQKPGVGSFINLQKSLTIQLEIEKNNQIPKFF